MSTEQLISTPMGDVSREDKVIQEMEEADESPLEVEVFDDRPEEDKVPSRVSTEESDVSNEDDLRSVTKSVQKRINKLKYDYHEERRSKESAERMREEAVHYAQHISGENQKLRDLLNRGEKVLIDEVRARAQTEVDSAKEKVKQALDEGESDAIVEAQEALAKASYDVQKATEYQPVTTEVTPQGPQGPQAPQAQRSRPPVRRPDPEAVEWAKNNSWFGSDKEMTAFAYAAHEVAVTEESLSPSSNEYYARIDQKMRERFPEKFDGDSGRTPGSELRTERTPSRPTTVVAPARRNNGSSPTKIQLTRTQVALAKRLGVTPEAYAKQVLELERNNG